MRHALRTVIALLGAVAAVLGLGVGAAFAAGESVQGMLRNAGEPVAGVTITVADGGGFSATAQTGADGRWEVPVPSTGSYTVELDEATLPDGMGLRFPDRNPITTEVNPNQQKTILFALGEGTKQTESMNSRVLNRFVQGLRFGLLIALAAVGLSLIFGTTGLTNFAHGELVTFGALVAFVFNVSIGLPMLVATVLTVVVGGAFGWFLDAVLWAPLRRRGTGLIAMMIVSIGLAILLRYGFLFIMSRPGEPFNAVGGSTASYAATRGQTAIGPGPITLTALDYLSMLVSVLVLLGFAYFLLRTRTGKATRAVADNPALAAASGIDVDSVIRIVWIAGGGLAALGGVLLGIAQQVNYLMGSQVLLLIFAAVTLGGLGTAFGALVGSLVVGVFVEMSALVIPPELKTIGALGILIVILLVRPQGILGRAQRVG